ncbi:hypothetical protein DV736_g6177, partial [Chaetothyriales sp. CBS 134916]
MRESEPRPASPESIPDSENVHDEASHTRQAKRRKTAQKDACFAAIAYARIYGRPSNPITPDSQSRLEGPTLHTAHTTMHQIQNTGNVLPSPSVEQNPSFGPNAVSLLRSVGPEDDAVEMDMDNSAVATFDAHRGTSHDTTVPTPPVEFDDGRGPPSRRALSSIPARLHVSGSPSAQDGSLPSPSLSPVTAAANLHQGDYFDDVDTNSEYLSQPGSPISGHSIRQFTPSRSISHEEADTGDEVVSVPKFNSFSLTEIPAMLDYFGAMPDELKGYVMHQLLRRCPKSTLHIVADVVNPALKCDFLALLPNELALYTIEYLDLKSLCKAAQVSRHWRKMVNEHEKVWKDLLDADGFTIPDEEMLQAIQEGWGWQDPHGHDGYDMNLSNGSVGIKSETEGDSPSPSLSYIHPANPLRRSKRKAATSALARSRLPKRKRTSRASRETSLDASTVDWMDYAGVRQSLSNAAQAAIRAVPDPEIGLPGLRSLHLYKSLYRRHYLIRRNWMYEDTQPRHIAFRAHDTHVVTCLQFDTNKILTGSDDNNINVYNTKTGALRSRLIGHEGGVWALQYEENTLVSGSTDRSVRVWDIDKGEERQVFRGHTSTVRCLQIVLPVKVGEAADNKPIMMPRQPLIITGSRDSTLRIWKLPRPEDPTFIQSEADADADDCPWFLRTLTGHQHSVRAIAAHGDTLVSGSYDCTVRVWKISTGESVLTLRGHAQKVYSVVLDHARNRCISGSMDNMVRIWDLDTGALRYSLEGHSSLVGLIDLQCERLVSAAADSTLRIWDPESGSCKATLTAHTGAITCFQHDGQKVISGSDRTLKLWDIRRGECVKDLLSDLSGVWQVRFDERRCVSAVQRDGVTFIEVLDFGAARDGIPENKRGRRIVVDAHGCEFGGDEDRFDLDGTQEA